MARRRARWRVALCCLSVTGVWWLTGCAATPPGHTHVSAFVTGHFHGEPRSVSVRPGNKPPLVRRATADSLYVMTWGSGSCPLIPTSVTASGATTVVIKTVEHAFGGGDSLACTDDLSATTSVVRLPATVDATSALVVRVDGTTVRLAAR